MEEITTTDLEAQMVNMQTALDDEVQKQASSLQEVRVQMAHLTSAAEQNKQRLEDLMDTMEFFRRNWKNKKMEQGEGGSSTRVVKPTTSRNTGYPPGFSTPTPTHFGTTNEPLFLEDPRIMRQVVVGTGIPTAISSSNSEPSVQAEPQVRPSLVSNTSTGVVHSNISIASVIPPVMNLPPLLNQYLHSIN